MTSLTTWVLPLLTATTPSGLRVDVPRLMLPPPLHTQALEAPCEMTLEKTLHGQPQLSTTGNCPEEISVLAQAMASHLTLEGPQGPSYTGLFGFKVPLAVDRKSPETRPEHEGDLKAWAVPKLKYMALPPRDEVPIGVTGRCTFLVQLDGSELPQLTPASCPEALVAPTRIALRHWAYRQRAMGLQPMLLPVTLHYVYKEGLQRLPESPDPFEVQVAVHDPKICLFNAYSMGGEVIARDPLHCTPEHWQQAQTMELPKIAGGSGWELTHFRWDPESDDVAIVDEVLSLSPRSGRVRAETPPGLSEGELEPCTILAQITRSGEVSATAPLECPDRQYLDVSRASREWRFTRFERIGWASTELAAVRLVYGNASVSATTREAPRGRDFKAVSYPELPGGTLQTQCVLRLEVDETGRLTRHTVNAGCPTAFRKAITAVMFDWTFWPAERDGVPQAGSYTMRVDFEHRRPS